MFSNERHARSRRQSRDPAGGDALVRILQRLVNVRVATLDLMLLLRQLFRPACLFFLHTMVVHVKYCAARALPSNVRLI